MRLGFAWCVVLAGCAFDASGVQPGAPDADPTAPDADPTAPDADPTAPDAGCAGELTFTPANVDPCDLPDPLGDFRFTSDVKHQIDTSSNTIRSGGTVISTLAHALVTQPGSSVQAMVIVADDLEIDAGVEISVIGSRPLIIVAMKTMRIDGAIDASGTAAAGGPGADLACTTGTGTDGPTQLGNQTVPIAGGAGGGGAGFGTDGGTGARVSPQTVAGPSTAAGAAWGTATTLSPLVGGCHGGAGGVAVNTDTPAAGGGGGGGLELVAGTELRIDGIVTVSGGGGGGAGVGSVVLELGGGGGGGGAGGALLLQSPQVRIMSGKLTANGGGGGEGRRDTEPGSPGADGVADDDTAAPGGDGVAGGNGGDGGALVIAAQPGEVGTGSTTATAGGGGGGGAVGRILFRATTLSVTGSDVVSPAAVNGQL